jgi:NADPH-dependent 7-cyano-7-deazaguanine reductase QueF
MRYYKRALVFSFFDFSTIRDHIAEKMIDDFKKYDSIKDAIFPYKNLEEFIEQQIYNYFKIIGKQEKADYFIIWGHFIITNDVSLECFWQTLNMLGIITQMKEHIKELIEKEGLK